MKTAGKFLSNIRNMDHGSKCKTIVVIRRRKWLIVKCVALAPTRRISCWTAPLTCLASSSSTVTLARQTTGMRVSLFNWLSLNLIGHPNHALDNYLMNLSLPGLLLAAWHQARSSRPRTAGQTCSQRRATSRRRQGQNHQFQGFRSLLYIDFICSEVKPIVCLSVLRLNSSHQVHVPEVGSTRRSKSPMRRAALEEDSSQIFPSPVFDRLSVSNKHSNGH